MENLLFLFCQKARTIHDQLISNFLPGYDSVSRMPSGQYDLKIWYKKNHFRRETTQKQKFLVSFAICHYEDVYLNKMLT